MANGWYWKIGAGRADRTMLMTRSHGSRVVLCAQGAKLMTRDPDLGVLVAITQDMEVAQLLASAPLLREGLEKSVQLQSHYAGLLNAHDGGERIIFGDADQWLARLASMEAAHV